MARPRAQSSAELPKEPHSVSLKVLRLSRPSLAQQYPLPRKSTKIPQAASLAFPVSAPEQDFVLTSGLTLPPSFGSTHVGETFSCSLCANNELPPGTSHKAVSAIRLVAEMQTPSQQAIPLKLYFPKPEDEQKELEPGKSMQRIIRFDLKEEGNHVLAVNISYSETTQGEAAAPAISGKSRNFRKLYQFIAQPCLSVRTKSTEYPPSELEGESYGSYGKLELLRYVLEAQLENVGDATIVLRQAFLEAPTPFKSTSLNWDLPSQDASKVQYPHLQPRSVYQVAFLIEQQQGVLEGIDTLQQDIRRDGRTVLGQLSIEWQSAMGDRGFLTTGSLMTRRTV